MKPKVCINAYTLNYEKGGGHFWVYLNWALGMKSIGCEVIWLEWISDQIKQKDLELKIELLRCRLKEYGFGDSLALYTHNDHVFDKNILDINAAAEADLLINFNYWTKNDIVQRFRRSVLIDIDPGLTQLWLTQGLIDIASHNRYFTIGEAVDKSSNKSFNEDIDWLYTPPCVALDWWPVCLAAEDAPFTTVSHWYSEESIEIEGEWRLNDKRSGFLPFLDIPMKSNQSFELTLNLGNDQIEKKNLQDHGWRICESTEVTATPWDYQKYIQKSKGEFSCVKPSCVILKNAWVSDRTLCYLASGKPAIIQHTGPSKILPDSSGLFRFNTLSEALRYIEMVVSDYENQCKLARSFAEKYFDAHKVAKNLLEKVLP